MQRARKAEDKEERRRAILAAAREMWGLEGSYVAFNMGEVAERAGLAKGTVYIYFATKEALLLELLTEELGEWMGVVDGRLDQGGVWSAKRVAGMMAETLAGRPMLTHLLALMSSILEHNVPEETVLGFKRFLRDRVGVTGGRLERRLPLLREGGGARVLVLCHALVTGLQPLSEPPPAVAKVLESAEMAVFRVDFERELGSALWALLVGMGALAEGGKG